MKTKEKTVYRRLGRSVVVLAAASATVLGMSACGGGSVKGSSGDAAAKTTILVWTSETGEGPKHMSAVADEFNKSQSTYEVQIQPGAASDQFTPKLLNAVKNNQGPSLVLGDATPQKLAQVIETGKVVQLDDKLSASGAAITKDNFTEGMLSTGTFGGKIYSLPTSGGDYALIYNKEMFKAAGISQPPATWAEVADDAAKLTKDGQYGIYLPMGGGEWPVFTWQSLLWSAGGQFLSPDNSKVAFNTPEGVRALSSWTDILRAGHAVPTSLASPSDGQGTGAFTSKKAAMMITGAYNLTKLDTALGKDNVGVAALPAVDKPAMNTGTNNSYILKTTPEQEAGAWAFLQHWLSPDVQAKTDIATGYLPTNRKTTEASEYKAYLEQNPRMKVFVDQLQYAKTRPSVVTYDAVSSALSTELEKALLLKESPEEALKTAADNGQKALDANKAG